VIPLATALVLASVLVPLAPLWVLSPSLAYGYGSLLGVVLLMLSTEVAS
jgi:hypothetical protein